MAVRYILFDAVGTLMYPDPPVADVYCALGQHHGSHLERDEIALRFRQAFSAAFLNRDDSPQALATSEALERERWRRVVSRVLDDVAADGDLFEELWRHFGRPSAWKLYDDVAQTWSELMSRGYTLGIASNFDQRLHSVVAGHVPLSQCGHVFTSSEIGWAKPGLHFYAAVQRRLSALASEILMVGDDHERDVATPRRAGWQALELVRGAHRQDALHSLRDLLSHLP